MASDVLEIQGPHLSDSLVSLTLVIRLLFFRRLTFVKEG